MIGEVALQCSSGRLIKSTRDCEKKVSSDRDNGYSGVEKGATRVGSTKMCCARAEMRTPVEKKPTHR